MALPLVKPLARALLRTARRYDRQPALRLLLEAPRSTQFDMVAAAWVALERDVPTTPSGIAAAVAAEAITQLCGGARLYTASEQQHTLQAAMSGAMRNALQTYEPEQLADAAFALLRRLDAGVRLGERVLGEAPTAPAVDGWPAVLTAPAPDKGDLLASHPLLRRDVVLLLQASGNEGYAFGLVVNAPTAGLMGAAPMLQGRGRQVGPPPSRAWTTGNRRLEETELAAARRLRDDDVAVFAGHRIHYGGPDGAGNLTMLHRHGGVRGCVQVRDGLFYGGDLAHAASLVAAGDAAADDFAFYKGRVDWRPGELVGELRHGEWAIGRLAGRPWPPPRLPDPPAAASPAQAAAAAASGSGGRWNFEGVRQRAERPPSPKDGGAPAPAEAPAAAGESPRGAGASAAEQAAAERAAYRLGAWAQVVGGLGLREWLALQVLRPEHLAELAPPQPGGTASPSAVPAWRTQEDWTPV